MRSLSKKQVLLLIGVAAALCSSGCGNWKKKYERLNVNYQNLKGQLERERAEKGQLAGEVAQRQTTIEELQRQIAERNQSPGEATGFGEGYDVSLDAAAGTITVTLPNAILFSPGKATLQSSANAKLNHIASVIKSEYAGMQIAVVGHTDSDPIKKSPWKDNWELSSQRALSVLRYLVKKGIPDENIRAAGRGASVPVASNSSSSGKAQNRRVQVVVYMR